MPRRNSRANRKNNRKNKNLPAPVSKPAQAINSRPQIPGLANANLSLTHTTETRFHSSLPPPEYLLAYDEIAPGSARAIIEAGVNQSNHRMALENLAIPMQLRRADRGVNFAFTLGLVGIASGVVIALWGGSQAAAISGSILSGTTLVGLATVFIYGTNSQRKERTEKSQENP